MMIIINLLKKEKEKLRNNENTLESYQQEFH